MFLIVPEPAFKPSLRSPVQSPGGTGAERRCGSRPPTFVLAGRETEQFGNPGANLLDPPRSPNLRVLTPACLRVISMPAWISPIVNVDWQRGIR